MFARVNNWETTDRKEIAKKISEMPLVGHKSRIVIITQGADDVIMVDETGKVSEIPICKVSKEEVYQSCQFLGWVETNQSNIRIFPMDICFYLASRYYANGFCRFQMLNTDVCRC